MKYVFYGEYPKVGYRLSGKNIASTRQNMSTGKKIPKTAWHSLPPDVLVRKLCADIDRGLSEQEARLRLESHGRARITRSGVLAFARYDQFDDAVQHDPLLKAMFALAVETVLFPTLNKPIRK